jgi:hypothetical protein
MRALKREKGQCHRAEEETRKKTLVPMKRFAREKKEYTARSLEEVHRIQNKGTFKTHVDDQTQQLVDFRLERERFGFFFSRHDDISITVRVSCALRNGVKISPREREGEKTII